MSEATHDPLSRPAPASPPAEVSSPAATFGSAPTPNGGADRTLEGEWPRCPLNRHVLSPGATIRNAMERLNELPGGSMTLLLTDESDRLAGTLTDGDLRRALVAGLSPEDPAERAAFRDFLALRPGDDAAATVAEARRRGVVIVPELDSDGRLAGLHDTRAWRQRLPMEAILMAGGKGERLRPLTLECPKPLLEVGGKPILDRNVERLLRAGVTRIRIVVNYLAPMIEQHVGRMRLSGEWPSTVECLREPEPLGTFGGVGLAAPFDCDDVLVMNADLLTNIDFEAMWRHHRDKGADMTMAAVTYTVSIPFSVLETEGEKVTAVAEKPTCNYLAGAGVYLLGRSVATAVAPNARLDAPDFASALIQRGGKVAFFPIEGLWVDIGSPDDYRRACEFAARPPGPVRL